ncbi:hypothetical protein [Dactylosporangium sp. NPDC005555]|uniref:hypothetical protein n=1 Tax=Dactylosporangium sp. NPDC005555 TaxID=3154889 RepID=UPI00339DF459
MSWLRWIRRIVAITVSLCALVGAVRLIAPATAPTGSTGEPAGVRRQLAFLRAALDDGAGEDAQRLYPEGLLADGLSSIFGALWSVVVLT